MPAYSSIRWLCPGRPSARPQPSNPFIPKYPGPVPSGQGNESGTVYDPLRPPIGQNTVNVMDGVARQALTQSPKGDKIWPPLPGFPEKGEDGDWRATKEPYLVLNLCLTSERLDAPGVSGSSQSVFK